MANTKTKPTKLGPPKSFTIDVRKWYRGLGDWGSALLRSDGQMCCLGFYALACGFKPEDILDIATPAGINVYIDEKVKAMPGLLKMNEEYVAKTTVCSDLMEVNDDFDMRDGPRMKKITQLFRKIGATVRWVGLPRAKRKVGK